MPVVPRNQFQELSPEDPSSQRDQRQPGKVLLERQDQAFGHGDAAMLTKGTEPRLDPLPAAPQLVLVAIELRSSIGNQVPGAGVGRLHRRPRKARMACELGSRQKNVVPWMRRE